MSKTARPGERGGGSGATSCEVRELRGGASGFAGRGGIFFENKVRMEGGLRAIQTNHKLRASKRQTIKQ